MNRLFRRLRKLFLQYKYIPFILCIGLIGYIFQYYFFKDFSRLAPTYGGTLYDITIGSGSNFTALNPFPTRLEEDVQKLLYTPLMRYNTETSALESGIMDMEVDETDTIYTLTLRDNAKYSDGTDITIDDIYWTLTSIYQNDALEHPYYKHRFDYISFEKVDDKTIKCTLPEPSSLFARSLTVPVLRYKDYENALLEELSDDDYPAHKNLLSTGPYVLERYYTDSTGVSRLYFKANKYYIEGAPYIENLVLEAYPDIENIIKQAPDATVYSHITPSEMDILASSKSFKSDDYTDKRYVLPRYTALFYNVDGVYTNRPSIRKALSISFLPSSVITNNYITVASPFFFDGIWKRPEYSIDKAKQLLNDGNITLKDGSRMIDNKPVELRIITSDTPPEYAMMAENIASIWRKELGFKVFVNSYNATEFKDIVAKRSYDLLLFGQNFTSNFDTFSPWHSTTKGTVNLSNITNETLDELMYRTTLSGSYEDLQILDRKLEDINAFISPSYS